MKLSNTLAAVADDLGLSDIIYIKDLKPSADNDYNWRFKQLAKRRAMLTSSEQATKYSITTRSKWVGKDSNIDLSFHKQVHIWQYQHSALRSPLDEMHKYGYNKKATIAFDCLDTGPLLGRFYLLAEDEDRLGSVEKVKQLQDQLFDIHYLLKTEEAEYLNPLLDYRIVTAKDIDILSHVAAGGTRDSIAEACNLTARGVDYRIARLKEKLGASNNANLVHLGHANGLVRPV